MNLQNTLSLLVLLLSTSILNAQTSLNTSGDNISSTDGSISYSVGQIFYDYQFTSTAQITEGVQQAFEIYILNIEDFTHSSVLISVYPNPTTESIFLEVKEEDLRNYNVQVFNLKGQKILERSIESKLTPIDLSQVPSNVYFLKVSHASKPVKSFKIIKK